VLYSLIRLYFSIHVFALLFSFTLFLAVLVLSWAVEPTKEEEEEEEYCFRFLCCILQLDFISPYMYLLHSSL